MKPSAKIVLDTRRALSTGKYPVKIRVAFVNGKRKYNYFEYTTGIDLFEVEFSKLYTATALQPKLNELMAMLSKASSILERKPHISKTDFDYQFTSKGNFESVQGLFDILIAEADSNSQITTKGLLKAVSGSITNFVKYKDPESDGSIILAEITPDFLHGYESWMLDNGKSYTTVGIYSRYIREVWNYAINEGLIDRTLYPFGRRKFVPPVSAGRKIALLEPQKDLVMNYQFQDPDKQMRLDFWKLSYLLFGINMKDILLLKWRNIEEYMGSKVIRIYRAKTFRKRTMKQIEIPLTNQAHAIILKYCTPSLNPDSYVFKVMDPEVTEQKIHDRKQKFVKNINKVMEDVSEALKLPKITTYTARHTFAYIMKMKGISLELRQEMMDHESAHTTERYGSGFELDKKIKAASML